MRQPWYSVAAAYVALALLASVYGYAFGLLGSVLFAPFLAPLALVAILAMWTMPELRYPPVRTMCGLLTAMLFALLCWPDYLALALPGMPWITAVRLFALPMMVVLLVCSFGSTRFRAALGDIFRGDKTLTWLIVMFTAIAGLSVAISINPAASVGRFFITAYAWIAVFFVSVFYFNKPGRVVRFAVFMLAIMVLSIVIGVWEARLERLPWAGHIPSFLQIDNPRVQALLGGVRRAASGKYRVQSRFSSSIGLGEFIGMAWPFLLQLLVYVQALWKKLFIIALIPVSAFVVLATDSRLAFICFSSSLLLYFFYQSFVTWRDRPTNLFAPAFLLAYPVFLALFLILSIVWRRLYVMIWGGGAESFSSEGRNEQIAMGVPMILHNPLGYGFGQGATKLNYIAFGADFPTIDSYYLATALETGVVGFIVFYGMFAWAIARSGYVALRSRDRETMFLAAACVGLVNFVISKSVYAETENHPLAFVLLGMVVALLRRYKAETGALPPPPDEDALKKPPPRANAAAPSALPAPAA